MPTVSAIIVAAGGSRRMGFDKLSADLCGAPVLSWSIRAFATCSVVGDIVVVTSPEKRQWVEGLARVSADSKAIAVIEGGSERHLSVWAGIEAVRERGTQFLAVHDGARPLITPEAIERCVDAAKASGAAVLAHPIADTVKRCDASGVVIESVDRAGLWAMETPQVFEAGLLREAYLQVLDRGEAVTDEVSAVQALGREVRVVSSEQPNGKITFPRDLAWANRCAVFD